MLQGVVTLALPGVGSFSGAGGGSFSVAGGGSLSGPGGGSFISWKQPHILMKFFFFQLICQDVTVAFLHLTFFIF